MTGLIEEHPFWSLGLGLSLFISFRISLGLWMLPKHRRAGFVRRLVWSLVVFVPMAGPLFFGAFYKVPKSHGYGGASPNSDAFSGGHGG